MSVKGVGPLPGGLLGVALPELGELREGPPEVGQVSPEVLRLSQTGALRTEPVVQREALGVVPAPEVTEAARDALEACAARLDQLDVGALAQLDPRIAAQLAPRLAPVRAMAKAVKKLAQLRREAQRQREGRRQG